MDYKEAYIKSVEKNTNDYKIFEKLCDRAKQIIINGLNCGGGFYYFYIWDIDEELLNMSPIEQIFCVAYRIYDLGAFNKDFKLSFAEQVFIKSKNKKYRCDFLVETITEGNEEKCLKKPLIIELDGYDYHSSKQQISYDYERENELKLCGYDVMRFTGSQVYNHPMRCIEKVYEYCKKAETQE